MPGALPALTELHLDGNSSLTSLQGMSAQLPALSWLDLQGDGRLTSLQGVPSLPELVQIGIAGLHLTEFDEFKSFPDLKIIYAPSSQENALPAELRSMVRQD